MSLHLFLMEIYEGNACMNLILGHVFVLLMYSVVFIV